MDWSKAKNIMIAMFLMLNTYLGINIVMNRPADAVSSDTIEYTKKILNERGVHFSKGTQIPSYNSSTPMVVFKNSEDDMNKVKDYLVEAGGDYIEKVEEENGFLKLEYSAGSETSDLDNEGIDLTDKEEIKKFLRKYMDGSSIPFNDFTEDRYRFNGNEVIIEFVHNYKGYLLFDNYMEFVIDSGGIREITVKYCSVEKFTAMKREIVPAHSVLMNHYLGLDNPVIDRIDFGFKATAGYEYQEDETVTRESHSPVWRVRLLDEYDDYYTAYDGKRLE